MRSEGEMEYKKLKITWEKYEELIGKLTTKINNYKINEKNIPIDAIITTGRGGLTVAACLAHRLNIKNVKVYRNGDKFYNNKIYLIVDDLADSGNTFLKLINNIGIDNTYCAALHMKKCSRIKPDFFVNFIDSDIWLQYPWETDETQVKDEE